MFEFPLLQGNAEFVLDEPTSIVITESTAQALFGDEDPINKIIRIDDESDLKVTGVLADIPKNSTFEFDFLMNWELNEKTAQWVANSKDNWGNYSCFFFLFFL